MNCKLVGSFIQHLEVTLEAGECFFAERGALVYHDDGVDMQSATQANGLAGMIGAHFSGESIFTVAYINRTGVSRKLVVGSSHGLVPVKLDGLEMICRRGSYVASNQKVEISTKLSVKGLIGGMGLFLQRIRGNATVFLDTIGQPIVVDLAIGQRISIDENHVIALHGISPERLQSKWSLGNLVKGEGISILQVAGPGKVYISPGRFSELALGR